MAEVTSASVIMPPPVSLGDLDLSAVVLSYDRESDTLMVPLHGRGEPGIRVVIDDHFLVRLDRRRERVVGFQIEGFLASVVRQHLQFLDALDVADLRGITLEGAARLRRALVSNVLNHLATAARATT